MRGEVSGREERERAFTRRKQLEGARVDADADESELHALQAARSVRSRSRVESEYAAVSV